MADDNVDRLRAQLRTIKRITKSQDAWHDRHPGMNRSTQTQDVLETDPYPDGPVLTTKMWADVLEAVVELVEARRG